MSNIFCADGVYYSHSDPNSPDFKTYVYKWRHLPTGREGQTTVYVAGDFADLCRLLNRWNKSSLDTWHYTA